MDDRLTQWPTGRLLSTAARMLEHSWEKVLAEYGISHAGLRVLHAISEEPAHQRDLARNAKVTEQTMSRTIERLERAGYVARRADPADERRKLVSPTEPGLAAYRALVEREQNDAGLTAGMGDVAELRRQLLALIHALET